MSLWGDAVDELEGDVFNLWNGLLAATVPWPFSYLLAMGSTPSAAASMGGGITSEGEVTTGSDGFGSDSPMLYGYNDGMDGTGPTGPDWDNDAGAKEAAPDWPTVDPYVPDLSKQDPSTGRSLASDPNALASNDLSNRDANIASDAPSYTPQQYDDMLKGKWTFVGSSPVSGSPGVYVDVYQRFDAEGNLQTTYRSQQPQPDQQGLVFEPVEVNITLNAKTSSTQAASEPANSLPANPFPISDDPDPLPENPFQTNSNTPDAGAPNTPPMPLNNPQTDTPTAPQMGDATTPFDPMADSPIAKWLLYGTDTPLRDWLTNDSNLHAIQLGAGGVAVGALTVATGGAAGGLAAGALGNLGIGLSAAETAIISGAAAGVAGGVEFRSGVAALADADTNLLTVGTPGPQLDTGDALSYVFDPQAIATDAALGGVFGVAEYAAPVIGRGAAQLLADTEGSVDLGWTPGGVLPAGDVPSASGVLPGGGAPRSGVGADLPSALSEGPWAGGGSGDTPPSGGGGGRNQPAGASGGPRINFARNRAEAQAFRNTRNTIDLETYQEYRRKFDGSATLPQPPKPEWTIPQNLGGPGHNKWGSTFGNKEGYLPPASGPFLEWQVTLETHVAPPRGALRIVTGANGEMWQTWTHYGSAPPGGTPLPGPPFLQVR